MGGSYSSVMDTCSRGFKVLLVGILATYSLGLEPSTSPPPGVPSSPPGVWPRVPRAMLKCNESQLLWEMEICVEGFKRNMAHIDSRHWCNLTYFISEYHLFTKCTEDKSRDISCYWPNPLVESYIILVHKHFFSNCTAERAVWVDPPDDMLATLILIPVFLTLAMIALVVWCSKRGDVMG